MSRHPLSMAAAVFCAAAVASPVLAQQETSSKVEQCSRKLGVMAVAEPQIGWNHLSQYGLGSPAALLRMMIQQSGCFDVVERGVAMQNLQQERALAQSGNLRQGSNLGQGQMQAADFVMTPNVQIAAQTTGGVGGALAGLGGRLGALGAIAGGLKFREASTSLLDNYNTIVLSVRDQQQLIRAGSAAGDANAAASTRAEAPQTAGQVLIAKITNVKVYAEPARDAKVVATLQRTDELVASGEAKNDFVFVDSSNFSGWVQRTLVGPR